MSDAAYFAFHYLRMCQNVYAGLLLDFGVPVAGRCVGAFSLFDDESGDACILLGADRKTDEEDDRRT